MMAVRFSEMSINFYQTTRRHTSQGRTLPTHYSENVKFTRFGVVSCFVMRNQRQKIA
jgi:hypothetical protein